VQRERRVDPPRDLDIFKERERERERERINEKRREKKSKLVGYNGMQSQTI